MKRDDASITRCKAAILTLLKTGYRLKGSEVRRGTLEFRDSHRIAAVNGLLKDGEITRSNKRLFGTFYEIAAKRVKCSEKL